MVIKFNKSLKDFKYLIMFDLASKTTGVCLWDLQAGRPIETKIIQVSGKTELPASELYYKIGECIEYFHNKMGFLYDEILVYKEAMPVQISGGASRVQTFVALARSHAILDLYLNKHDIAVYDYVGVYPISTHAYLKKLRGWESDHKVDKTHIKSYVCEVYGYDTISMDESDAVFLAQTFAESKWNKDIDEEIRNVKKHMKELSAQHAVEACKSQIERLQGLKV